MPQCEGTNIFASGDYLLDERQGYLCNTIERLRVHMLALKEKLQEEKMLLSELKAETQYLTRQHEIVRNCEQTQTNYYQSETSDNQNSSNTPYNKPRISDVMKPKHVEKKPSNAEESMQQIDRVKYAHRLMEIDSLCKEEMARMNSVVEQMEPLKQIASDWMLETRLKEVSGTSLNEKNTVEENTGKPEKIFDSEAGTETVIYSRPVTAVTYNSGVVVLPPRRPTSPTSIFMFEGKSGKEYDPSVILQAPQFSSNSKTDLKSTKGSEVKLDSQLKPTHYDTNAALDGKDSFLKRNNEMDTNNSSSEVSLSSLEALKEKNITLNSIEGTGYDEYANSKNTENGVEEEDWKSPVSEITSKSAISLESIQRAFADHHKKKRKAMKTECSDADALSFLGMVQGGRGNVMLGRNGAEDHKLFSYLHPSAKKIVKNWVMVGKEDNKETRLPQKKPERTKPKRCTLNLGRNKDTDISLCEDDVINKFLYDEEGYVYTPLFVSETEDECGSDSNSASES